ncbi:site-specific integrase [Corynebacterium qintianiae]|uniref:Site-specific integrase n=1 Tax=Corynebacterium qintianiae TaxID=2709392 RepID=A0A7T0KNE6_9CORY|nr:site-specific integrase [Corynebacterium qintianiae]QPK83365.1 site-specific integrase [Corynebacterium qintianiae]
MHYSPTFRSKGHAHAWLEKEERLIAVGGWTSPKSRRAKEQLEKQRKSVLLLDFALQKIENRAKAGEIAQTTQANYLTLYENNFAPFLTGVTLEQWTVERCHDWWEELTSSKDTLTTHKRSAELLNSISEDAVNEGILKENPVAKLAGRKKKVPHKEKVIPTPSEFRALIAAASPRYQAAYWLAGTTGLRRNEILELRLKDLETVGGAHYLRISRQVVWNKKGNGKSEKLITPPKNNRLRRVALDHQTFEVLERHIEKYCEGNSPEQLIFTTSARKQVHQSSWGTRFRDARARANISEDITFHSLRHLAGTTYAQSGATIKEIMDRLGHSTPQTAMIYQHTAQGREESLANLVAESLGPFPEQEN